MKYLILSDLHGGYEQAACALSYFNTLKCDLILILGDLLNHGPRNKLPQSYDPAKLSSLLNEHKHKIMCIRGNCDSEVDSMLFSFPCNAPYMTLFVTTDHGLQKIFITHGHLHKFTDSELLDKLALKSGDIVLSGHTHIAGITKLENGIININPGSTSLPKGGTEASFATFDEHEFVLYNLKGEQVGSHKI